jgi:hypothetical protein
VREWEYRKIDLSQQQPRSDELALLNAAGADGWELVAITANNVAYLKRPIAETAPEGVTTRSPETITAGGDVREGEVPEVKAKYRNPVTNETWSGRGRMATWLRKKQEAGEDIDKYLVEQ